MSAIFDLVASILVLAAVFAWFNARIVGLPGNIAILALGLCTSLLLLAMQALFPSAQLFSQLAHSIRGIDFYQTIMHGLLGFLLFAGALHVDLSRLRNRALPIAALATAGVFISAAFVGLGLWSVAKLLGIEISIGMAFLFGTLISPTDPVAVLTTMKAVNVPEELEMDMTGEALFNDGVGVILFSIAVELTLGQEGQASLGQFLALVSWEIGGGALLGFATGLLAYQALRGINEYPIEVMISLALVTGTYALALNLHMSGLIAVVVAGLLIGDKGAAEAMSDITRRYVFGFWGLVDDILNAVLFLLVGLEILVVDYKPYFLPICLLAIPLVALARLLAVGIPVRLLGRWQRFPRGTVPVLTWGGVRGGICIALALSLPDGPDRSWILFATYAVVIFSVIIQGLTLKSAIRRFVPGTRSDEQDDRERGPA